MPRSHDSTVVPLKDVRKGLFLLLSLFFLSVATPFLISVRTRDTVTIPDLIGKDVIKGSIELQRYGLQPKILYSPENESGVTPNQILRQTPKGGTSVKQGRTVSLVIPRAEVVSFTLIPDFRDQYTEAVVKEVAELDKNSLTQISVAEPFLWERSSSPKGNVLAQYPLPNQEMKASQVDITLVVSLGDL